MAMKVQPAAPEKNKGTKRPLGILAGEGGAVIPLGIHIDADVLAEAHTWAMKVTEGHPEIESQVEALARRGMQAHKDGDLATSLQLNLQAWQLIDNADGKLAKQGPEQAKKDQATLAQLLLGAIGVGDCDE